MFCGHANAGKKPHKKPKTAWHNILFSAPIDESTQRGSVHPKVLDAVQNHPQKKAALKGPPEAVL